jgi:hypothetical protein
MFIHLVSLTKGAVRMIVVSQLDRANQMRGLITTLHKRGAMLIPVSAPIVYIKRHDFDAVAMGEIPPSAMDFAAYKQTLAEAIEQGYARLVGP